MNDLKPAELRLFIILWVLLVISSSLWWFWPHPNNHPRMPSPEIQIGADLKPILSRARLKSQETSKYTLELTVASPILLKKLEVPQKIYLNYQFERGDIIVYTGTAVFELIPHNTQMTVLLPNPELHSPKIIRLNLAR